MISSALCVLVLLPAVFAQLNQASADDDLNTSNKFRQREATSTASTASSASDSDANSTGWSQCPSTSFIDLAIRWHAETPSSIHATPLITDLFSDNFRDILVPGRESLSLISGRTGAIDTNFEVSLSRGAHLYASPLLYDVDYDGVMDVRVAGYHGRVEFVKDTGADAMYGFTVPRLRVRRGWYEGLREDPVDHSRPDVGVGGGSDDGVGERAGGKRRLLERAGVEENGRLSDAASSSFDELFGGDDYDEDEEGENAKMPDAFLDDANVDVDVDYERGFGRGDDVAHVDYYDDGVVDDERSSRLWHDDDDDDDDGDDNVAGRRTSVRDSSEYVWVDAHMQTTPVIGDIDGDGHDEVVLAVSYFFDQAEYAADSKLRRYVVGEDGDINRYLASGVVAFDLATRRLKWSQHLDLSTGYTRFKAAALASPALADVNGDGKLEVVVGTSMGFLYVLDGASGDALEGWPLQMGDIQGHVAVADIDQDGKLEIVAADTRGSIAAFRGDGSEVWEKHIGSAFVAGATFGDADGDGQLEVAFATLDGRVYLADAATGIVKDGWPFRTFGEITAPVLIAKVDGGPRHLGRRGMQLVVTSHDGYLYVIDGEMRCSKALNLGESSDAMVLFDDLASNGEMDLLVATTGGNVYSIRTTSPYHPLKTRTALYPGLAEASYVSPWSWMGVYADAGSRVPRDVRGSNVQIRLTVLDRRPLRFTNPKTSYKVTATLVGVGAREMNTGEQPVIGLTQYVNSTGTYTIDLPCPRSRTTATIRLSVTDENGSTYVDEFPLSFHVHFYRLLKWLVVLPLTAMSMVVLTVLGGEELPTLPSM